MTVCASEDDWSDWHPLPDEAATEALGAALSQGLAQGGVIFLQGHLGAGKTTVSRGLLHALGHRGAVKSPTYTLVEPYESLTPPVYHFDLYRLIDPEELELMGIRDYVSAGQACLIEWPDRGKGYLPQADCELELKQAGAARAFRLRAMTPKGGRLVNAVNKKCL